MILLQTAVRATIKTQYHFDFTMEYTSHRPKQCPGGEIKENSCERKYSEWPVLV